MVLHPCLCVRAAKALKRLSIYLFINECAISSFKDVFELFNASMHPFKTCARTSDSLNERLPIKIARKKFQRKR